MDGGREVLHHTDLVLADVKFLALRESLKDRTTVEKVELLPLWKLRLEKYEAPGMEFPLRDVPETTTDRITELYRYLPSAWQ